MWEKLIFISKTIFLGLVIFEATDETAMTHLEVPVAVEFFWYFSTGRCNWTVFSDPKFLQLRKVVEFCRERWIAIARGLCFKVRYRWHSGAAFLPKHQFKDFYYNIADDSLLPNDSPKHIGLKFWRDMDAKFSDEALRLIDDPAIVPISVPTLDELRSHFSVKSEPFSTHYEVILSRRILPKPDNLEPELMEKCGFEPCSDSEEDDVIDLTQNDVIDLAYDDSSTLVSL